ncbi:hypothetical protein DPMN_137149 [Dreissena polymorpha]|uniref:Uncharacterized protein n=1 Tax=Dreissena polymorpha TaxID=45954 RepID=A0A9D4JEH0_DREPO|nr:hypothetical protein DPMN_137149 [Dreissena polymorpha]
MFAEHEQKNIVSQEKLKDRYFYRGSYGLLLILRCSDKPKVEEADATALNRFIQRLLYF